MSEFKEEGFLSTEMVDTAQECRRQHSEWFALCESMNRFSLALASRLVCHPNNRQECLAAALFLRTISIFEGTVVLIERCMLIEAKILLRTLMETLFALRAITLHAEVADEFYGSQYITKLKALRKFMEAHLDLAYFPRRDLTEHGLTERIRELDGLVGSDRTEMRTRDLAEKAGLLDFYNVAYTVLSWTVHSNILDIAGSHMAGQSDSDISGVYLGLQMEKVEQWFLSACECMVVAMQSVNGMFRIGVENEITDYERRYKSRFASYWTAINEQS